MTKKYRILFVISIFIIAIGVVGIISLTMHNNISFFYSPSELKSNPNILFTKQQINIGGIIKKDSIKYLSDNKTITFTVSDTQNEIVILYNGILPNLFREGQGVVAKGTVNDVGIFTASELLTKHDENYKPGKTYQQELSNKKNNNTNNY